MKNILLLPSWYPDKVQPLSGDFIERHARAASRTNNITVIYIVKDPIGITPGKNYVEKRNYSDTFNAIILYYKPVTGIKALESLISGARYFLLYRKLIKQHIRSHGKPDLVNVHVGYKAGLAALYCKWRYGISYVISEQWTIFCPEARPGFKDQPFPARWFLKIIYKNSLGCSAVSDYLANALARRFDIAKPIRIPNVVDTTLFRPRATDENIFRFIHISVLHFQKSPEQIIRAIQLLSAKTNQPFEVLIFGPRREHLMHLSAEYGLEHIIDFRGEVNHEVLSVELGKSNALILYSRFETFGCVIVEAYASGVPVIVSDIPVMREIVEEGGTGIFVPLDDPETLAAKMLWMIDNREFFDRGSLTRLAEEKYGYEIISRQFDAFYDR